MILEKTFLLLALGELLERPLAGLIGEFLLLVNSMG